MIKLSNNFYKNLFWISVFFYFIILIIPANTINDEIRKIDKLIHFLSFTFMTFIGYLGLNISNKLKILIMFFLAIFSELLQFTITGRNFSLYDIYYNFLGILIGYLLFYLYNYKIQKKIN